MVLRLLKGPTHTTTESHRLRLYLSHPERYSLVQDLFDGLFHDVDTRCSRVLKSLREEHVSGPDFIWRMYHLSPAELGSRDGCGLKTFRELSARLQLFRRHLGQSLNQSHIPTPEAD